MEKKDEKMKKIIAILAAAALLLTFAACSAKPADPAPADPTPADPAPTADTTQPVGMPNPVTVYGSLAEINEIVGMKLTHPPVMGVTDEEFKTIDFGDWKIAEYDYKVAGVEYHLRGCPSFDDDISGYYINGEPAFSGMPTDEIAYAEDGDVRLARWATMDGQYVLSAVGANDAFPDIAEELKGLTIPGMSESDLAAYYAALEGEYYDEFSQRAHMKAEALGADGVRLTVHWAGSAFENYEWVMTGRLYEDGLLSYSDCVKTLYKTDEDGNTSSEVESEGGEGFFTPTEDGKLLWDGAEDDYCRECIFFIPPEA